MIVRADACVVGSGAGGAVVARELAEGGMDVVVLEEGGERSAAAVTGRPRDMLPRLYRDGGQVVTIGRPPLLLPLGRGTGGTTFVNSGTCFRTPPAVLARWREELGLDGLTEAAMEPAFERVERELGVAEVPPALAGANAAMIRRGAARLGWSGGMLKRNARGCQGSGVCAFGCPTGAKQHVAETYLPKALDAGARILTGVRAERVVMRGDRAGWREGRARWGGDRGWGGSAGPPARAAGVVARTSDGGRVEVEAPLVVLAAGTVHTPLLLARSGLGHASGRLGTGLSLHPATAIWGLFDEEIDMARGVPQSVYVDEFAAEGIMLEGIAGPPDYLAMAAPFAGDRLRELMLRFRHVGQCGLMVSDRSRGRIVLRRRGRPIVRYDVADADVATVKAGLERLAELMWAAGARSVVLPIARLRELHGGDSAPLRRLDLRAGDLKLMAFHPLGTARPHADPRHGVLDGDLEVHGARGVHVADGSAVAGPLGVNPQITIMALATRLAFHLLEEPCPS